MIIVKLFMKGSAKMIDFSGYECNINVILLKALEYDRGQFEKGWKEGFHDGYIHGLEIAIIEIENTIGRTKKSEKLCAILQDYKKDKVGEE